MDDEGGLLMSTAVGKPIERVDGRAKVTGAAKYAGDFRPERFAHAVIVQSTIAKGRILEIDTADAHRAAGVISILTHENAPKLQAKPPSGGGAGGGGGNLGEKLMPLADDTVHFAGQHIACVIAETLDEARHAASLLRVRYQEDTPVLDMTAAEPNATFPEKALGGEEAQHRRGDVEAALAASAASDTVKIEPTYTIPVETNNPMEPSATVAAWEGDRLTVEDATQAVIGTRNLLAGLFGLPRQNVRVICPFTGGGFGCKGHQWPHTILAAMAAREVRRPVKLVLTRAQMFTSVGHRPPTVQRLALAARRDGTLTAIRHETLNPASPLTEFVSPCGAVTSKQMYTCDNVAAVNKLVRVNVGAPTPMRAPAESPATFALESAMDELAYALGMDPLELRLKSYADKDPAEGKPWSSKHLRECYERGAAKFGWKNRKPEPRSMKDGDLLVGWGMATAFYPGKRQPSSAKVRITADGRALVQAATQELGTGSYTVFTQVAADALGLPVDRVTFELGDSDLPEAPFSAGSCSAASVSEAIVQAAAAVKAKLPGGSSYADLLKRAGLPFVEAEVSVKPDDPKIKAHNVHSFGAQFCEVKIDPLLPRVQVTRWVSVIDGGRILNARTAESQIIGAIVMGIGMALMEETVYDPRTGRPVTDNLADYHIPVNADLVPIEVEFIDEPDPVINTLGCRGVGEIGITGAAAAIANAVYHATGKRVRDLPITMDKLL
jgi:xanthine dehydrogenase YagR molybdenum-binding subunit